MFQITISIWHRLVTACWMCSCQADGYLVFGPDLCVKFLDIHVIVDKSTSTKQTTSSLILHFALRRSLDPLKSSGYTPFALSIAYIHQEGPSPMNDDLRNSPSRPQL
jgi:hypothetical protein